MFQVIRFSRVSFVSKGCEPHHKWMVVASALAYVLGTVRPLQSEVRAVHPLDFFIQGFL